MGRVRAGIGGLVVAALAGMAMSPAITSAARTRLTLSASSVVPGQALVLKARGLAVKRAAVTIGGRRARVVSRRRGRLTVLVPRLKPGVRFIVIRVGRHRLRSHLRVRRGFKRRIRPTLDRRRAVSGQVGPRGGVVEARGADGTTYSLTVPPGALDTTTTITLTPVRKLHGVPVADRHRPAVGFGPEGLTLSKPARLRIQPAKPLRQPVGLTYTAGGRDVSFQGVRKVGTALVLTIKHFSGAGAAHMTVAEFQALLASYAAQPMTLALATEFFSALRPFGMSFCQSDPTCTLVLGDAEQLLGTFDARTCGSVVNGAFAGAMAATISLLLDVEGERQLFGLRPKPSLPACRARITAAMERLVHDKVRNDPLAVSGPCADVHGDTDGDGKTREIECALFVAGKAAEQAFDILKGIAVDDATAGLQQVLTDGNQECQAKQFPEGQELLRKGLGMAAPAQILVQEYVDALEACVPKITVSPATASVEIGHTHNFTATSDDPADATVNWSADAGSIDTNSGHFTAPAKPGSVTITATSVAHPDRHGVATVTVTCSPGQVESGGNCVLITIDISPTSVVLLPGETQRFRATVHNTPDTRVSWSESGPGSITQPSATDAGGLYTAPQTPGDYTVSAASVRDPTKRVTANVTVSPPGKINFVSRNSRRDVSANAGAGEAGQHTGCSPASVHDPKATFDTFTARGLWTGSLSTGQSSASITCGGDTSTASATASADVSEDVSDPPGGDIFNLTTSFTPTHQATVANSGPNAEGGAFLASFLSTDLLLDVTEGAVRISCSITPATPTGSGAPLPVSQSITLPDGSSMSAGDPAKAVTMAPGRYSLRVVETAGSDNTPVLQTTNRSVNLQLECHRTK